MDMKAHRTYSAVEKRRKGEESEKAWAVPAARRPARMEARMAGPSLDVYRSFFGWESTRSRGYDAIAMHRSPSMVVGRWGDDMS